MNLLKVSSGKSWQPVTTVDTTTSSYWLNWRVLLCSIWVLMSMFFAYILILNYEGPRNSQHRSRETQEEPKPKVGLLYEDEVWKPCLKGVHPAWLLAFRVIAFFVLLILLIRNVVKDGGEILYFYTQWTFTLVTIYFGLGSLLSLYGCSKYHSKVGGERTSNEDLEDSSGAKHSSTNQESNVSQTAGFLGYVFQLIFQINAGAVMLTDCVFWFILVPFLAIKDYKLNYLIIYMHSLNAIFLLGDTALNCLRFPWFRIAYFILWTSLFVIFQWILHACISLWWPYPFLDLSSPYAPLWYFSVAVMHIPCYGIFVLVMKMKHFLLSKWFPHSYQCMK